MPRIVLSYRRDDSPGMAPAIFNRLERHFGPNTIFMDIDIPFGTDFRDHLGEVLNDCDALIAIVGQKWDGPIEGKPSRIKEDDDWVRLEVETSLRRGVAVIPALVDGASMPSKEQLASSISQRLSSVAGPYLVGVILPAYGVSGVFAMFAVFALIGGITCALFSEETAGKTLEQLSPAKAAAG